MIEQIVKDIAEVRKDGYDVVHIEMSDEMWHKLTREFPLQVSDQVVEIPRFAWIGVIRNKYFPPDHLRIVKGRVRPNGEVTTLI